MKGTGQSLGLHRLYISVQCVTMWPLAGQVERGKSCLDVRIRTKNNSVHRESEKRNSIRLA